MYSIEKAKNDFKLVAQNETDETSANNLALVLLETTVINIFLMRQLLSDDAYLLPI